MNEVISKKIAEALKREFGWGVQNADGAVTAGFCCEYCDTNLIDSLNNYDSWQIDHIIPKDKNGSEELDNIALSCRTCNHLKHAYVPSGDSRSERIKNAKDYVGLKRSAKEQELKKLIEIIESVKSKHGS